MLHFNPSLLFLVSPSPLKFNDSSEGKKRKRDFSKTVPREEIDWDLFTLGCPTALAAPWAVWPTMGAGLATATAAPGGGAAVMSRPMLLLLLLPRHHPPPPTGTAASTKATRARTMVAPALVGWRRPWLDGLHRCLPRWERGRRASSR